MTVSWLDPSAAVKVAKVALMPDSPVGSGVGAATGAHAFRQAAGHAEVPPGLSLVRM